MVKEFHNEFKIVKSIFEEADDNLKFNLSKIILEGPEEDLKLTKILNPQF